MKVIRKRRNSPVSSLLSLAMSNRATAALHILLIMVCGAALQNAAGQTAFATRSGNAQRTGVSATEPYLNSANVNVKLFGKLFTYKVDGFIVGQPLYVPGVSIPGLGVHNVVYVATQHDSLYAFDSDTHNATPLWSVSFTNPTAGVTSVPITDQGCPTVTQFQEVGIMGTPAIDLSTSTIYVSVKTKEVSGTSTSYVHRLHALDIATGQEKFNGPAVISGTYPSSTGLVNFNSLNEVQRPGLLLANGNVYVAFGSNGCDKQARGWVFAYNASDLTQQAGVLSLEPNQSYGASIWMSGSGLAADDAGNVYFSTANGLLDAYAGGTDYGDSVVKLSPTNASSVADYFAPSDQGVLYTNDLDLGSGGVVLLPDQPGPVTHELVTVGKEGTIYLLNRDNLGEYNPAGDFQIVQEIPSAIGEMQGSGALWNNTVYFSGKSDTIKAFSLANGLLSTEPTMQSKLIQPMGSPTISANGTGNGLLWLIRSQSGGNGILSAFNAYTLGELYNTTQNTTRDAVGTVPHFATPTVANGRVYVGGQTQLVVYGLFPNLVMTGGNNQSGTVNTVLPLPLSLQALDPYSGNGIAGTTISCSDAGAGGSFSNAMNPTDGLGNFSVNYTLPKLVKTVKITCGAAGYTSVVFTAVANPGPVAVLALVSGAYQGATVGTTLANPLVVKAKDAYTNPVPGAQVTWSDGNVGGTFSANPVSTNSQGLASVYYQVPTAARKISVSASSPGVTAVTFPETSLAGPPASNTLVSGNNQTGAAGSQLTNPLIIVVKDSYGNPVPNVTVTYSDNGSGGTFSSATTVTNAKGQASASYTLPPTPGTVNISAGVSGLTPVSFTEKAQ